MYKNSVILIGASTLFAPPRKAIVRGPIKSFQDPAVNKIKSSEWPLKRVQGDNKSRGFTLIELLVVVLIIGILSAVALPQYQRAVAKSRLTQALTWAKTMRDAEQVYYMANSAFTQNLDELDVSLPDCASAGTGWYTCGGGWRIHLTTVPSIYVYLPDKYTGGGAVGVEYYFSPSLDRRLCFCSGEKWCQLCKSFDGGKFASHQGGVDYYTIP